MTLKKKSCLKFILGSWLHFHPQGCYLFSRSPRHKRVDFATSQKMKNSIIFNDHFFLTKGSNACL